LVDKLYHFVPLVEQGIDQGIRRALRGEQVPAAEMVLDHLEELAMIIPGAPLSMVLSLQPMHVAAWAMIVVHCGYQIASQPL
jgi:hypothetical protein